jgi:hypothetical protein
MLKVESVKSVNWFLAIRSDLDRYIHTRRKVEFLELVHGFGGGLDDVDEALMSALLESFLRFFVRVRGALHGEAFDTSWEGDRPGDTGASALYGVGNIPGGLVNDTMVIGLEANTNALSSHRKNNCLLMVLKRFHSPFGETERGI